MMTLQEKILQIIEDMQSKFIGVNEGNLHASYEIAEYIEEHYTKIDNDFESVLNELGFKKSIANPLEYIKILDSISYKVEYEGYAYVLYKAYFINLNFTYIAISHFQDSKKFKTFFELLTDKVK